jgi:hypothetical protein
VPVSPLLDETTYEVHKSCGSGKNRRGARDKPQRCVNLRRVALPKRCKSCFGEREFFKERKALKLSVFDASQMREQQESWRPRKRYGALKGEKL